MCLFPPAEGPAEPSATLVIGHPVEREATFHEGIMRPMRVHTALKNSKSFEEFRKNSNPLGDALQLEAAKNRPTVVLLSLDNKKDPTLDLSMASGHKAMMQDVELYQSHVLLWPWA